MLDRALIKPSLPIIALAAAVLLAAFPGQAQKIVCWKDKTGKVVGCGDRIPPEFRENESKILDSRGLPRGTKVSAEEAERLKEEEQKKAAQKAEENRRLAEQRRQDSALINTYTSAREIDQRRDRELQVVELQITQLKASLKGAAEAHARTQKRHDSLAKGGKPAPDNVRDELARATEEKNRLEARIAEKEKDKERITANYAEQRSRYIELKGGPAQPEAAKSTAKK